MGHGGRGGPSRDAGAHEERPLREGGAARRKGRARPPEAGRRRGLAGECSNCLLTFDWFGLFVRISHSIKSRRRVAVMNFVIISKVLFI